MEKTKIKFSYNGTNAIIEAVKDEYMKDIFKKFSLEIKVEINNLFFLYNGNIIEGKWKLEEIIDQKRIVENDLIIILVCEIEDDDVKDYIKQSKQIICLKCKEFCKISFDDYKIILNKCPNGHSFSNLLLNEISNFEVINEKEIICNNCPKSKADSAGFYYCCNCKIILCPLCKLKHNNLQHLMLNYESKDSICNDHGERYILYSKNLKKNFCDLCYIDKNKYDYSFLYLIKNKNNNNNINQLKIKINELKGKINNITNKDNSSIINDIIDNLEKYFEFMSNLINNPNNRNYHSLTNINSIYNYNEIIMKDISNIIKEKKEDKYNLLNEIYNKMIINNEIILKYKIDDEKKIRLFGDLFVKNNKDNYVLIINGKKYELMSFLNLEGMYLKKGEIIEIKLKQIKNTLDISFMFSECRSLINISNTSKWKVDNIINFEGMFNQCNSLKFFSQIYHWHTDNAINMSYMFSGCKDIPCLCNWNTSNVTNMSYMFSECSSVPDISKWDTSNVTDMSFMFYKCSHIPDISNWNINKVTDMSGMFSRCTYIPDISKWNTSNVKNMKYMFNECETKSDNLKMNSNNNYSDDFKMRAVQAPFIQSPYSCMPDILKMNHNNSFTGMNTNQQFMQSNYSCAPDILKMNHNNSFTGMNTNQQFMQINCMNTNMQFMQSNYSCAPDILKMNHNNSFTGKNNNQQFIQNSNLNSGFMQIPYSHTPNIMNPPGMINNFSNMNIQNSLEDNNRPIIPDISKWNINNVTDMSGMFRKCSYIPDISKWNTHNVINMSHMFSLCKNIPDISKWNTNKVINMGGMFIGCSSIPDISKWNTSNVNSMCFMFSAAHLYLIFQNGIQVMSQICAICLMIAHLYLIFQNGI